MKKPYAGKMFQTSSDGEKTFRKISFYQRFSVPIKFLAVAFPLFGVLARRFVPENGKLAILWTFVLVTPVLLLMSLHKWYLMYASMGKFEKVDGLISADINKFKGLQRRPRTYFLIFFCGFVGFFLVGMGLMTFLSPPPHFSRQDAELAIPMLFAMGGIFIGGSSLVWLIHRTVLRWNKKGTRLQ